MIIWPLIFGTLGTISLVRGLYHSKRYVVEKGTIECSGLRNLTCSPTEIIDTIPGESVNSLCNGVVAAVGDNFLHVVAYDEPVILYYYGILSELKVNDKVGLGQKLGIVEKEKLEFGVTEMYPNKGQIGLKSIIPVTWLSSRGLKLVNSNIGKKVWCEGSHINIPQSTCTDYKIASKPPFALFGMSATRV